MELIKEYEYKAPSYERMNRENQYVIDEAKAKNDSRYTFEHGVWKAEKSGNDEISMLFAGDLLCQENMISAFTTKEGRYDFKYCFEFLRPLFKAADFIAGNLETPTTDSAPYRGEILTHEGPFFCNAPVEYLEALKYAGFDMLTTANNHTLDAGADGLYDTIINSRKFDFIQTGTFLDKSEKFVIVEIGGIKVGFTAFGTTYNMMQNNLTKAGRITLLNTYSTNRAQTVYSQMKNAGAEYTICFPHWGQEYTDVITEKQRAMAEELTSLGYDLVVGSHSHVVQRFEEINGKPVLFSLGNLISHMNLTKKSMDSQYPVLMNVKLKKENGKISTKIDFIPCRIFKELNGIPFVVVPVDAHLELDTSITSKLENTPDEVSRLLMCDNHMLNTEYPVDVNIKWQLHEFLQKREERLEKLAKQEVVSVNSEELPEEKDTGLKFIKKMIAKPDFENRNGKYKFSGSNAEMICLDVKSTVVKIDKEIEGKPVTVVNNYKQKNNTARILYMGKHVESVGKKAFSHFSKLESVRFYESLEVIEEEAFAYCERLSGITLPKSIKEIKRRAFADCPGLMSIKIPNDIKSISDDAFSGCNKLTIYCNKNSYAAKYAKKNNIAVKYMPL